MFDLKYMCNCRFRVRLDFCIFNLLEVNDIDDGGRGVLSDGKFIIGNVVLLLG